MNSRIMSHNGATATVPGTFLLAITTTLILVVLASLNFVSWTTILVLTVGLVVTRGLGRRLATGRDAAWLPTLLPIAFIVKMLGAFAVYQIYNLPSEGYQGGDAAGYYRTGVEIAPLLRQLQWPDLSLRGLGAQTVERVAGVFYAVTEMDILGGYLLFATVSFFGLILFYLAYRRAVTDPSLKLYFLGVFFLPTLVLWPSAIGKDALMTFTLGLAAFGTARLLTYQAKSGLVLVVSGVALTYTIRPHIATMVLGAVVVGFLASLQMAATHFKAMRYRVGILVIAGAALVALVPVALSQIGAEEGLVAFAEEVQQRTARGSASFESTPVVSLTGIPLGIISVISRPFPFEAKSAAQLVASLEGLFLLIMLARSLPRMLRDRRQFLNQPYLSFALAFTLSFIVAFSSFSNFGTLARQRAQLLPFLIIIIAAFSPLPHRLGDEIQEVVEPLGDRNDPSETGPGFSERCGDPDLRPSEPV